MNYSNETILHIDLNKLTQNLNYLKSKLDTNTKIIAVVKAFAYGHGDIEVSKKLEQLGIYAFWVSDFEEGVNLRKAGIKTKIIVANTGMKSYEKIVKYNLDVVLYNNALLHLYCSKKNPVNIHLKFNTGMNRYGFNPNMASSIVSKIQNNCHLNLMSVCSHLAASDDRSKIDFSLKQIEKFISISKEVELILNEKIDKHILNTHGVLNFLKHQMNSVRLGVGIYGSASDSNLRQIGSFFSVITQTRYLEKGEPIGYGCSFYAKEKIKIAIIPVGYADGLNRKLSNNVGSVFINNCKCPIVGEISMDSFAANITECGAQEGDLVEIFGENIAVSEIAKKINTIPYEIYSTLNRRIKRVYSS